MSRPRMLTERMRGGIPCVLVLLSQVILATLLCGQNSAPADAVARSDGYFAYKLYPILENAQCHRCHNDNGIASATRLEFPPEDATADEIDAFGLRLAILVDRSHPDQSLLFRKPTNRLEHTGGERIRQGSEEEKVLQAWINYLVSLPEEHVAAARNTPGHAEPQAGVVRRLTHSQYDHTVRDLLGDQTHPAAQFPKEDFIHGFTNQAEGQTISPLLAEAYNQAAEKLARNAFRGGDLNHLVPCKPASASDTACSEQFIREFGRQAFRQPLAGREIDRYKKLFLQEAARTGRFLEGARIVVEAMLQSPHFLFYTEPGPQGGRNPYSIASRLSYFLWDTMPDEALFHAAASGELATRAGIETVARRMVRDPRAELALDEFLAQWLRFDRLHSAVRDRRLYPEFSAELVASMTEETRRLFHYLVWQNKKFMELYTAGYAFLNTDLAHLYGLPVPKEEFAMVEFPANSERSGILGQGTFLTVTSKPSDSSPTERGVFIREHFLCQIVPPPPPGVNTNLPPLTDAKPMTNRERMQMHLAIESCAVCHRLIDPIGFGLERYDAIGRFREKQLVKLFPTFDEARLKIKTKPTEYRLDIDTAAFVRGVPHSEFSSPKQLGRILADDPGCQRCVVKQLFRYALGRPETPADQPAIEAAFKAFRDSQFRLQDLIISIVTSETFLGGLD